MRALIASVLLALLPAGALAQSAPPALTPIRVAVIGYADATSLPVYAQAAGIFKKYGLDATVTSFNGGGAIIAAVAGGSLEMGFSNLVSAASALQRGIPIIVLAPAAIFDDKNPVDNALVKAKGSKLKTGADLAGKAVAVTTLGGGLQLAASAWIDKTGGDSKTVHFVELPNSEMPAALKAGRIDAAMISEPALTQAKADVDLLADAFGAIAPRYTLGVFAASKSWVAANPDAAHRFVQAMVKLHAGQTPITPKRQKSSRLSSAPTQRASQPPHAQPSATRSPTRCSNPNSTSPTNTASSKPPTTPTKS